MRHLTEIALTILLWLITGFNGLAADMPDTTGHKPYRASLITIYPGSEVFELFGHTDLRLITDNGTDMIFNYGVFDFNSDNFFFRFVKGETDYMCEAYPTYFLKEGYDGRRMVEQQLNLSDEQVRRMWNYLVMNAQPMYRNYRYKYFSDNCSTRPLNVIEDFLGNKLTFPDDGRRVTFRDIIHGYTRNYAWEQLGIDLLIGRDADTIITRRQTMFVPMLMMEAMRAETVTRDGATAPLVTSEQVINPGSEQGLVLGPTPWPIRPVLVFSALLVLAVTLTISDIRRRKVCRPADAVLWNVATAVGLLMWFVTFISTHEATSPNFNALWLHPFYAVPLVLMWIKGARPMLRLFHAANAAVLLVALVQWPICGQSPNPAFFPAIALLLTRNINYLIVDLRCKKSK